MLPLALDVADLPIALVGTGAAALARLARLEEAGARRVTVFAPAPSPELAAAAGKRLRRRWPTARDLVPVRLVFIADLPEPRRSALAAAARAAKALVHVEDAPALSELHAPAVVRRGDLAIAISTGGTSPALAAVLKRFLEQVFGPEWGRRTERLSERRRAWRAAGATPAAVARLTAHWIRSRNWLGARPAASARRRRASRAPS